ncbi:hypothetical protein DICPUDRAFT_88339 [Dictyostelium purpureum]|uniref:Glutamine amidotransferase type-2 domain-containing protein n=1 Tax=Dictyostelium purpureum TaxID=5786 RepID=F0ZNT5_DICPU|nr:uncharacterized protein DICPUDRAFT_88339 [Dictyostelium purpureum]EGC34394.1 hypothetical protein DICPUDRAFT_88339 [Dictyostelium purpureum]|eukprot:XP_003289068.1 hypothetical protein DICPUDRAFT_88339 [Dictyostelium purpureum]
MCGISGWIDWSKDISNEHGIIKKMNDSVIHRGPDAEGFWSSENAQIGHRRLIVIDPEGGKQPMVYKNERTGASVVLTYNGELYNFKELKEELVSKGHTFKSYSDTEVILRSYLEWNEECLNHFNGIFAFAIYDERKSTLFLARDHLGIKPLFYCLRGRTILFGSELKVLLSHPKVKPVLDTNGLCEVLFHGPVRTPGCGIFQGVYEVPGGQYIVFSKTRNQHGTIIVKADHRVYWNLKSSPHTDDEETTVQKIKTLLSDSLKRQLVSDVPLVAMLSGGLDSSGLVSLASDEFKKNQETLKTFSMTFENDEKDFRPSVIRIDRDEPWARKVSEYCNTNHHTVELGAQQLLDNILEPMRARDLPGYGEVETSVYLLFKEMKKFGTVAISGECSDEIFSGYHQWFANERYLGFKNFPWLEIAFAETHLYLKKDVLSKLNRTKFLQKNYKECIKSIPYLKGESELQCKQRKLSYLFIKRFIPFALDRKDRLSMKSGFEVRVPFSDKELVEYVWNLPYNSKAIDNIEKGILRRALKGFLPEDALYRRKSGYPSICDNNYFFGLCDLMLKIIDDETAPIHKLFDTERVLNDIISRRDKIENNFREKVLLDYLIQFNAWLKEYNIILNF